MGRIRVALAAAVLLALSASACGDDGEIDTSTSSTSSVSTTTTGAGPTTSVDDGELPGERMDLYPYEGAELGVVGVAADDTLNVRSGPGVEFDVVFELEPLETGFTATGHNRALDDAWWSEIMRGGDRGWVNTRFVSQLGQVTDITTRIAPLPADLPSAETMLQLGEAVGALVASDDPPSDIVVVDGPTVGDLGEITVDVIGLGDDAQAGERLHVFAQPNPDGESFTVRTVEATALCARGVTEDGLCV